MAGTIEDRLTAVEATLVELNNAVYGHWDYAKNKRTAGLLEQITLLTNIMKWGILPLMVLDALREFGIQEFLPSMLKLIPLLIH